MLSILRTVLSLMSTAGSEARLQRISAAGAAGLAGVIALGLLVAGGIFLLLFSAFTALLTSVTISMAAFIVGAGLLIAIGIGVVTVWMVLRRRRPIVPPAMGAPLGIDLDGIGKLVETAAQTIKKRPELIAGVAAGIIFGMLANRKR